MMRQIGHLIGVLLGAFALVVGVGMPATATNQCVSFEDVPAGRVFAGEIHWMGVRGSRGAGRPGRVRLRMVPSM